jgi:hypothetical protein
MLYLNPPFWLINGISLLPDHADASQYYFMPMMPHLTTSRDSTLGVDMPQLQLIKYRGSAGNGGFLNLDVDLSIPDDLLKDTASQLRQQAKLDVTPRLAPVPIVDGTVRMLLLGDASALPADPAPKPGAATPVPARFVIKMQSAGKPSLYGDENATFSVQLDQDGVTIVEKALQGDLSPIGIVYSLDFFALRPAYSVRVSVDWERVQHHLDESFQVDAVFFSSDIDKVVDQLIEKRVIVVEADTFVPEGDDTKDLEARRDQALAEVREMIKSTFFQSSIEPPKPGDPDGWDKAAGFANSLSRLGITGGASALGSFSYKKVDITRIDKKTLNASFQERTAVRKTIWPQGHLAGLFRQVKAGLSLDRFITSVDLDNPYFQRRTVQAISRANFETDGIASIDANFTYSGRPQNVILESAAGKDRASVDWPSTLATGGGMVRDVAYSYRVTFKDADRSQRPVQLETGPLTTIEDAVEIVPRETLYSLADVPITALLFPFDRFPAVDVECRYSDDDNKIRQQQLFRLTKDAPNASFRMFMRDPTRRQFDYRVALHGADGKDVSVPWTSSDDEQVLVRDPSPKTRQLVVVPQCDWSAVNHIFVDLSYQDGPNPDDEIDQSFDFVEKDPASRTFTVNPKDPAQKLIGYEVTVLLKNQTSVKVPKSYTADRRLIVRPDMRGHRVIAVSPANTPFADAHVQSVDVLLRYVDEPNGLGFNDQFKFNSEADRATFEFDYVDGAKNKYDYKITTHFDNGMAREGDWQSEGSDALVVAVG